MSDVLENRGWQFPGMIAGYVPTGEPTCASSLDTCYTFPVQQEHDGAPLVSFDSWIARGYKGNESLDIWFSPIKSHHSINERAGDTELMVWTAWPGVNARSRLGDDVTIDGKRFGIMTWEADHGGARWRYVAYLWLNAPNGDKGRQVNVSGLWLNPFFKNAESHGWLKSSDWLWSIATGFEMNDNGRTNNIHNQPRGTADIMTKTERLKRTRSVSVRRRCFRRFSVGDRYVTSRAGRYRHGHGPARSRFWP